VADAVAGRRLHLMRVTIDPRHRRAEPQVDVMLAVPRLVVHVDGVELGCAGEVLLGQRRSLVRTMMFIADQGDRSLESLLAQRLSCLGPGQAGADDDEVGISHGARSLESTVAIVTIVDGPGPP